MFSYGPVNVAKKTSQIYGGFVAGAVVIAGTVYLTAGDRMKPDLPMPGRPDTVTTVSDFRETY